MGEVKIPEWLKTRVEIYTWLLKQGLSFEEIKYILNEPNFNYPD